MKRATWSFVIGVAVVLGAPREPAAQYYYGGYYGGYGGYATTPMEGWAFGMAACVRSAGMYNAMTSAATKNLAEAQSIALDNRRKATEQYCEEARLRAEYQEARKANRKPPPTSEQMYRWAKQGIPKPLNSSELDPVSGAIIWPIVLQDDAFASYRMVAEHFYTSRATGSSGATYDLYASFQQASAEGQSLLKSRIKEYKADDYIRAKKFLDSLAYEARSSS
jgi:hypothetical protein